MNLPEPHIKAHELYTQTYHYIYDVIRDDNKVVAKEFTLAQVDEIINALEQINDMHNFYWSEVRSEVEKL